MAQGIATIGRSLHSAPKDVGIFAVPMIVNTIAIDKLFPTTLVLLESVQPMVLV